MERNIINAGIYHRDLKYKHGISCSSFIIFRRVYEAFLCNTSSLLDFKNDIIKHRITMTHYDADVIFNILKDDYNKGIRLDFTKPKLSTQLSGEHALICEECFNILSYTYRVNILAPLDYYGEDHLEFSIGITCPHCGKKMYHFDVDANIANLVSILNKRGYYTQYSCEGHSHCKYDSSAPEEGKTREHPYYLFNYSNPYVFIRGNKKLSKTFYNLILKYKWDIEVVNKECKTPNNPDAPDYYAINDPDKCIGSKEFVIRLGHANYVGPLLYNLTKNLKSPNNVKFIDSTLNGEFKYKCDELYKAIRDKRGRL